MTPEEQVRMNALVISIQQEKDHRRFEGLLRELNELIARKEARFPECRCGSTRLHRRPWKTVSGIVQKIVKGVYRSNVDHAEIIIPEAEDLFREVRIENTFTDVDGQAVALKQGARVDVTFEADPTDTIKKTADGHA